LEQHIQSLEKRIKIGRGGGEGEEEEEEEEDIKAWLQV